jgi:glycine/D-amino acid oxidase-like deaminating enzyme
MSQDVIVVGAGIVGCATAAYLAGRGVRVTVFDAGPVGAGASGRNAGLVEHPYDLDQHGLYQETVALLKETLGESMPNEPADVLLLFDDRAECDQVVLEKERFPGLSPQRKTPDEIAALEPSLRTGRWGCLLHTGYPIRPASVVSRFAELAQDRGATIVTDAPVGLLWEGGVVRGVVTGDGTETSDAVLVAAGAATSAIIDPSARWEPVRPLWGVSLSLTTDAKPNHPVLDGRVAAIQSGRGASSEATVAFSLIPTPDRLALGSTFLDAKPSESEWVDELIANARQFWAPANDAIVDDVRQCARPRSFDGRPLLGRVAGHRTLWVACGHGGRGMSTGAASARLIADAMIADTDQGVPQALRASRAEQPPVH